MGYLESIRSGVPCSSDFYIGWPAYPATIPDDARRRADLCGAHFVAAPEARSGP